MKKPVEAIERMREWASGGQGAGRRNALPGRAREGMAYFCVRKAGREVGG